MTAGTSRWRKVEREPSTFAIGAKCGAQIIDARLGERTKQCVGHVRTEEFFACHCSRCQSEAELSRSGLLTAIRHDAKGCRVCSCMTDDEIEVRLNKADPEPIAFCGQCYDIPDCRPHDGPCKCGELYERDELHVEQFISSGVSNLGSLIDSRRSHDGEAEYGKTEPHHKTKTYRAIAAEFEAMT